MKKIWVVSLLLCCFFPIQMEGKILFQFKQSDLFITSEAPPALVYVSDNQGRITGANPNQPVDSNGYQGDIPSSGLREIPSSLVLQDRIENNSANGWNIDIADGGAQTYTINILGIITGNAQIDVGATLLNNPAQSKNTFKNIHVLINPGQLRKVILAFDPVQGKTNLQPVVANGDLLNDVKAACQLNLITSKRICKYLEKKADAIQSALDEKHNHEAKALIVSFLHNLGELRGDGCNDEDDREPIQKNALKALIEDAKALLVQLDKY
jgi:hypothetical protein